MEFAGYGKLPSGKEYDIWKEYLDIEEMVSDLFATRPNLLNALSTSEVAALEKNDMGLIYSILLDSQIIASQMREYEKILSQGGKDVFESKNYMDGENIILEFHTVRYY